MGMENEIVFNFINLNNVSMKSIKEKAEEYVDDYYQKLGISKDEYPTDVKISKVDFEAGANYVLDIIQRFVIENYFDLEYIVKQLKK